MQQQTHAQKWNEHWTKSCFAKDNSIFQLDERSELRLVKLLEIKKTLFKLDSCASEASQVCLTVA